MILNNTAGKVVGPARNARTEQECFGLYMTKEILTKVCERTNRRIQLWSGGFTLEQRDKIRRSGKYTWVKETTVVELKALFGC